MKTAYFICFFIVLGLNAAPVPEISVAERGPHHSVWQRVTEHKTPYGRSYYVTNSYKEIATGKNYFKTDQWVPSTPEIAILASGFGAATQLQHKVIFAPNINTLGAIDCLTPDDKRLRSHVLGLAYTDKATGKGVMIAEIKDSTGVLVGNNQVLYPDAFDSEGGFRADIRYTVTLAGIEQDIILVESPPDPRIYGIQPENCRLEVYSEFIEFAEPAKQATVLGAEADANARNAMVEPDLIEEKLIFGTMRMDQGAAFRFGDVETTYPMGKTWEEREGRQLLIERADYTAMQAELSRLPQVAKVDNPKKTTLVKGAGPPRQGSFLPKRPPNAHAALRKIRPQQMAQANLPRQGFVLDYQLMTAQTNFTFRGDETYFVSGQVILSGTTTLEGGAVIKGTNGLGSRRVWVQGTLDCRTSPYRPAIFTGKDDDTVGQIISGSTGQPGTNYYGYLLDLSSNTNAIDLRHVAIRYGYYGINAIGADLTLTHAQIGPSFNAVVVNGAKGRFRNVLIYESRDHALGGAGVTGYPQGENVTFHGVNKLRSSGTSYLTNCLLIAVTNNLLYIGINNETNINDAGVFQTAGFGARYLASGSSYRDAGTTGIDSALLVALRQRTTFPPLILTNNVTINTNLGVQAQRDTGAPDLGYHYLPIDWIVGGITATGATLTVSGGVTIAMDAANTNWGIRLDSGAQLISDGGPVNPNRFVRTHSVQEIPAGSGTTTAPLFADTHPAPASPVTLSLRFTEIPQIQRDFAFHQESGIGTFGTVIVRDSHFRGGTNYFSQSVSNQFMAWTNVLFENSGCFLYPYTPTAFHIRNSTFASSASNVLALYVVAGSTWSINDCIFADVILTNSGAGTITHDYNGYLTNAARLVPIANNDVILPTNTVTFQTGPLGFHYLPTNSGFLNAGSRNATNAQLYHYCTTTNQAPETNSIVDLGFHYVALNSAGQPEDSNSPTNGVPNYIEDPNGNGIVDAGETAFTTLIASITSPTNNAGFNVGENIGISASASAAWSTISWVEFYSNGTNLLSQDSTSPFSFNGFLPAGIHTLTARARADAGISVTSGPVTITVYGSLFVVGDTNLSAHDNAIKGRLEALKFYPLVKEDTQSSSNDGIAKGLIVISKSVTSGNVGDKFTYHSTPLLCWEDPLLDNLKMTGTTDGTHYGSTNGQTELSVVDPAHPMAANLLGTVLVTTANSEFSWGVPGSNAVKVVRLTGNTNRFGIFGYESNAMMFALEAPSRRSGFFLGNVNPANLTTDGWNLFDAAVRWVIGTNDAPSINWLGPTNDSTFVASTNITLGATASDIDSGLKKVNFYRTGVRIGQADTVSQQTNFSLVWSNAIAGRHVLSARAFDQGGLSSTSGQFIAVTVLSNALFVTGSPTLNPSETNLKARIEGLGFVVTIKAAANVSTADASGKTVVVISSTSAAAEVTNKFTYAPTPVVVWQNELFDDLGMTRTNATDFGIATAHSQVPILTSHTLAAGLTGTVSVTASTSDLSWGAPGSNAIAVASVAGDSGKFPIFAYEKGVIMPGIGTNVLAAPARRVGFFLTSDTATLLTSQGWELFDAAIRWAVAKPCPDLLDLFLVMDVSNSLTNSDFARAKRSSSNFVSFLKPDQDRVGLVTFAGDVQVNSPLTSDGSEWRA